MEVSWRLVRCGKNVPKAKSVILLEDREVVIGRNVAQKYRVDNANVSRNHARLKLDAEGRWSIEDLRSHNGVFVNGEKIPALRPLVILENDLIGLGRPAPTGDDVYVFRLVKSGKDSKVSARVEPLAVTVDDDDDDDDVQITAVINLPAASTSHSRPPAGSVRNAECEQARLRAGASLTAKLTKRTTERNLVRSSFTNGTVSQIQELSPQASIPCKQEPLVATVKAEAEDLLSSNASSSEPVRVCSPIPKQNCAVSTAAVLKAARSETALTTKSGPNKMGSVIVKTEHQDTVWVSTDDSCGSHSSLETCSGIGAPSPMQALNTSVPLQGAGNQFSVVKTEPQTYEVPPVSASKINMNTFINFLLSWKVQWLKEQMNAATLPPILDMEKVRAKRNMYSSMDEYKMIHYHFLCLEIWEDVFKKWRDYFSRTKHLTFQSVITHHECPLGDVMILSCVVVVGSEAEQKSEYPMEGHLVRLDLRIRDQDKAALPVLGFITKNKLQSKNVSRSSLPHLLQPLHAPKCVLISLTVYVKARDITLNFNKVHRMTVVSKITPTLRQMEAVADLEQSPYGQVVVRPNAHYFWHRTGGAVSKDLLLNYNSQQQEVVSSAVHAMNMPGSDIRVIILHGPPGTGKTHTLIGIVMGCLFGSSHRSILIVAPSNAAVDEIGRRLLAQRAVQSSQKVPGGQVLKLVRVGQDKMIHPEVRGIVLEELVKKNIQSEKRDRLQDYDREIESRRKRLARLRRDMTKSGDVKLLHRLEFETKHLEADILRLSEEKRKCLQGFSRQSYEMKLKILRKANVVLSTLNSCRSRLLEEAFGRASPQCFSSVIVDEATQCTEVETLLCLQYRTSRLVLIGDPLQLPATVLSRHAVQLNFQESLFERFYKCLENEKKGGAQAVFMLTDQRRMHSEICSFPSRYFYDGKLQPVAGLDASYASFPLNPYLVFNVLGSPEMNDGSSTSMANHGEAEFVVRLCHTVRKVVGPGTSICVITFYRAQKTTISELLQRDSSFEVNTVDGFQGQERDVVVLSCVRASHPLGYIGFVADARRLNVSITRARKALFICGHLDTLEDSLEWSALIKDARNRDRVRNVSADCSSRELGQFIAK
ncbi:splicing endonuclease positive effector sen1, putative [Ixodes scapularis]|uniref:Splicing endonuclease positive effector sen1, putative n=1 Tax=Ixodes scapularis TaxID=6945 RepID=B7Q258_IXOSC|nr:splicing endonuclease positive effector sen1, putative [Ixodes scapularis]|eukprot:XP_002410507.1 splicing endonuclease positive effector sen1, putative [Ixodes scapularis]